MTTIVCDFCDKEIEGAPVALRIEHGDYVRDVTEKVEVLDEEGKRAWCVNGKSEFRDGPTVEYAFHVECVGYWAPAARRAGHIGRYQIQQLTEQCEALNKRPKKRGAKMTCANCRKPTSAELSSVVLTSPGRRRRFCHRCVRMAASSIQ